jgi:hypothetical protein
MLSPSPRTRVQEARELGLVCVVWLFTDLLPLDASSGTVRHSDTYFLSSYEVITAASPAASLLTVATAQSLPQSSSRVTPTTR